MAGSIGGINALWLVAVSYALWRGEQYVVVFLEHPHFPPSYPPGWSHFEKPLKNLWQALTAESNGVTLPSLFYHDQTNNLHVIIAVEKATGSPVLGVLKI